ncbi:MAG: hypothetical protein IT159_00555 [Bryobacterales bacterium]|nr:hypothetical protein [Bryobacterales bacterium]
MASAADLKLSRQERYELIRGLSAEFATAAVPLPRSKQTLLLSSDGAYDKNLWDRIGRESGPAARVGDLVQVTKLGLESDRIVLQLNGGAKGGPKWYERIEVGTGTRTTPIGGGSYRTAPGGTTLALVFRERITPLTSAEVKKLLAPVLDFNRRSATEQYFEKLPEPIKQAIKEKKATDGMDREQVLLALGKPNRKVRETVADAEVEDWIYGTPPGRVVFVTFEGDKVVRVKEAYAGLGGVVAEPLPTPR